MLDLARKVRMFCKTLLLHYPLVSSHLISSHLFCSLFQHSVFLFPFHHFVLPFLIFILHLSQLTEVFPATDGVVVDMVAPYGVSASNAAMCGAVLAAAQVRA